MEFLPIKDVYEDFNLKTISILRWAVDRGMNENTSMIVLHDDALETGKDGLTMV